MGSRITPSYYDIDTQLEFIYSKLSKVETSEGSIGCENNTKKKNAKGSIYLQPNFFFLDL